MNPKERSQCAAGDAAIACPSAMIVDTIKVSRSGASNLVVTSGADPSAIT
jgi:hypothetical protein